MALEKLKAFSTRAAAVVKDENVVANKYEDKCSRSKHRVGSANKELACSEVEVTETTQKADAGLTKVKKLSLKIQYVLGPAKGNKKRK